MTPLRWPAKKDGGGNEDKEIEVPGRKSE